MQGRPLRRDRLLAENAPAIPIEETGLALRKTATPSQRVMLRCLSDMVARLPPDWAPEAIGAAAEAELLDRDTAKYRQVLAARG